MKSGLLAPVAIAGVVNASAFVVDGNTAGALSALVATVIVTLAIVKWIDGRIDHKIRNYANTVRWQHRTTLQEISNLRELMGHPPLNVPELIAVEEDDKDKEIA